jgi:hypothetical protein
MINYSSSVRISQLNQLTSSAISLDDYFPIVDNGTVTTYRLTLGNFKGMLFSTASVGNDTNVIFESGSALSASGNFRFNYTTNTLHVTNSIIVPSITASLYGTASQAATASIAISASYVIAANSTFANSSSYVSGSTGNLKNLYLSVNGQKAAPYYSNLVNDSGIYLTSYTTNSASFAEIYISPSGSTVGTNDYVNNSGLWINGGYINTTASLPIYLGGNPNNPSIINPTAAITIARGGNVGINIMNPSYPLHVNGTANITAVSSSNENVLNSVSVFNGTGTSKLSVNSALQGYAGAAITTVGGIAIGNSDYFSDPWNDAAIIFVSSSTATADNGGLYFRTWDNGAEGFFFENNASSGTGYNYKRFSLAPNTVSSPDGFGRNNTDATGVSTKAIVYGDMYVVPEPSSSIGGGISASIIISPSITGSLYGTASVALSIPKFLMPSAWGYLSGSLGSNLITQSNSAYNVISASRSAQGKYVIYFTSGSITNSNYCVMINPDDNSLTGNTFNGTFSVWNIKKSPLSCSFSCSVHSETTPGTPDYRDVSSVNLVVYSY